MALQFHNSLTRQMQVFEPITPQKVKLYTCGPTVYNYAHIGNFRAYIFEDLLRRYLRYKGHEVTQVMNLTDIDDKTIRGCRNEQISLQQFTDRYKKSFFEDLDTLNIKRAEIYPAATDHIPDMVQLIKQLREKGFTYESKGSIYFKINSFPNYGKLAHLDISGLRDGARIDSDEYEKEEARDFALWKSWSEEDGDVYWETELGKGRPGWHIECSAMSMKYLGETFDIHTGGIDNLFPHHENEIAQSEAATGKTFVNYWLHCSHLIVDGKKMSKSLGNFFTLRDLIHQGLDPLAIRYTLLTTHYRQPLNFTIEGVLAASQAMQRIRDFHHNLQVIQTNQSPVSRIVEAADKMNREFENAMDDDLNIAGAMGKIFEFIKEWNPTVINGKLNQSECVLVMKIFKGLDQVLGIKIAPPSDLKNDLSERLIQLLISLRQNARQDKNWQLSDQIRDQLRELNVLLEDRPDKTTTYKILN